MEMKNIIIAWGFLLSCISIGFSSPEDKVCIGTNGRFSVPSVRQHHYQNLRNRYTNCTYVDGNLELTWLQDENLDLAFLEEIREVTGYVLISHVDVKKIVLPKLMIIRGRNLFKLHNVTDEFSLVVIRSKMENLELPALRDILAGNVGFLDNYNLCHIRSIKWDEILTGASAKPVYVSNNFTHPQGECPQCDASCEGGCWGEGPNNCQNFSKVNCSSQCQQQGGRCFGPNPHECCHSFCAVGCTGPTQAHCMACRNFDDNGVCRQECPPAMHYNPETYSWESNPHRKYAYGTTCVPDCPEHLLRDSSGLCVTSCPANKKVENHECVPCDGPCPKYCIGVDVINAGNIDSFSGCTTIEGSITILDSSFTGYQEIYRNFTFGPVYPEMHPSKLEVFSTLKQVTGYINIQASHPDFRSLAFFRNLGVIGGRQLTEYSSALYIVKTSLISLNMRSLKKVNSGKVAILENEALCFASTINWSTLRQTPAAHQDILQRNANENLCQQEHLMCDPQCSKDGCWGVGPVECLSCAAYKLGDTCVENCSVEEGIYDAGDICERCHEECLGNCSGPGNGNCSACRNVRDGPFCVDKCPDTKYNQNGECMPCHEACVGGCFGPANNISSNGCKFCENALVSSLYPNIVEECLRADEPCPEGYYLEYNTGLLEEHLKSLTGRSFCRKCHQECRNCSSYGTHSTVCNCMRYHLGEECVQHCPSNHYADEANQLCIKCANECRGCRGPNATDCIACRKYRVYNASDKTTFNCTASCPDDKPFRLFDHDIVYCSSETHDEAVLRQIIWTWLGRKLIA